MIISRRTKYNPCTACLSENSESWLSRLSLFSNYIEMYSCLNLLVEAQGGGVLAEGLGISHLDELSLYLEASLCQLIGDGGSIYGTIEVAVGINLGSDGECSQRIDFLSQLEGIVLNLFELVSLLTKILSEHLLCRFRSDDSLTGGDKIVTAIAVLNGHDIVLVTETLYVFLLNNFNNALRLKGYFIK